MTDDDSRLDRRQFVRGATAATIGFATMGSGSAAARTTTLSEHAADPADVESTFETYGGELFDLLAADGLLSDRGLDDLPTDRSIGVQDLATGDREGTVHLSFDGHPDELKTVSRVDGGVLTVGVQPATGSAHAVFEPDGSDTTYLYDPDRGYAGVDRDATASDVTCTCEDVFCQTNSYRYSLFCWDDSGTYFAGCC